MEVERESVVLMRPIRGCSLAISPFLQPSTHPAASQIASPSFLLPPLLTRFPSPPLPSHSPVPPLPPPFPPLPSSSLIPSLPPPSLPPASRLRAEPCARPFPLVWRDRAGRGGRVFDWLALAWPREYSATRTTPRPLPPLLRLPAQISPFPLSPFPFPAPPGQLLPSASFVPFFPSFPLASPLPSPSPSPSIRRPFFVATPFAALLSSPRPPLRSASPAALPPRPPRPRPLPRPHPHGPH